MSFRKGDQVEVCSDEEGFKGAWFPATIVRKAGLGFLVEFRDLVTDDGKSKLREKIEVDEIRPQPPYMNRQHFVIDEQVDAYDQDGWWEGVIGNVLDDNNYVIFFSHFGEKGEFNVSQLRLHLDWVDEKWLQPSQTTIQHHVPCPNCQENMEHISPRPERRSTRLNKGKSKTYDDEIPEQDKADAPCGYLQSAGTKLNEKTGKRKLSANNQLHDDSLEKEKMGVAGKDVESAETFSTSKKQIIDLCKSQAEFSIDTEVTLSEDMEKTTGYPVNTPEISASANLKKSELHAYHSILKALYLQGNHTWEIEVLLTDIREVLHITQEEHATQLRHIISAQRK
ncbi:hypothetical protein SUGI_0533680 [Cryptomeria japonica]|nr:hypothetical protein SUGI_0533680 [Cryptomeria japonica]